MRRLSWSVGAIAAAVLSGAAQVSATVVGLPAWDVAPSPNPDTPSELNGVARVAPDQVWAVGARGNRSLTARWNGSAFVAVSSPNVSDRARVLEDVDGVAGNDVWAVGHSDRLDAVGSRTFIVHWDGASWRKVPSPSLGDADAVNVLSGVVAVSADDAWAVGWFTGTGPTSNKALTLHWNGSDWRSVANECGPFLRDIVAVSPTNVWAVGGNSGCQWNGSKWTRRTAAPHTNANVAIDLQDVTATGPANVWAVGYGSTSCGEGVCFTGVIEHWNGAAWSFTSVGESLFGVDARGPSDIYAVGLGNGPAVLHYAGANWERVPVPSPVPVGRLLAVDAVANGPIWATGWQLQNGRIRTLAERAPSPNSGAVVGSTGVGNATVSWIGPEQGSVTSDQTGRYLVGGLKGGTYTFFATFPGCTPRSKSFGIAAGTTSSLSLLIGC